MVAKRIEQGTAEAQDVAIRCIVGEGCPMGWIYSERGKRCYCIPGLFFRKADDADLALPGNEDARDPFDYQAFCTKTMEGRCPKSTEGFWDHHYSRCYCGRSEMPSPDIIPRAELGGSRTRFDPQVFCKNWMKARCASGNMGLWNSHAGHCYCERPKRTNVEIVPREELGDSASPLHHMLSCVYKRCPRGTVGDWDSRTGSCFCGPLILKPIVDIVPREEDEDPRTRYDPRFVCVKIMKGRCPPRSVGYWDKRSGHCYCGAPKKASVNDIVSREELGESRSPFNPHAVGDQYASDAGRSDPHTDHCHCESREEDVDLNTRDAGCHCEPRKEDLDLNTGGNDAEISSIQNDGGTNISIPLMLTQRLMSQPLKFPTGISYPDWTAIQVSLALLGGYVKSQSDLHQICTGAQKPEVYGFKLDIFRRLCTPGEIHVPVSPLDLRLAERKVSSALFIDTMLQRYKNDYGLACQAVKRSGAIPDVLDTEWIRTVLCH